MVSEVCIPTRERGNERLLSSFSRERIYFLRRMKVAFSDVERKVLLDVKGVGPTVVQRFEEIGIDSFAALAAYQVDDIAEMVAAMLHTTCWKNSPQAKAAIDAAIAKAKEGI